MYIYICIYVYTYIYLAALLIPEMRYGLRKVDVDATVVDKSAVHLKIGLKNNRKNVTV